MFYGFFCQAGVHQALNRFADAEFADFPRCTKFLALKNSADALAGNALFRERKRFS